MAVELLKKGQKVDLTKGTGVQRINVALGWDTNKYSGGHDFDLDVSVFMCDSTGKVRDDGDFIFYNKLEHDSKAVIHTGDERTGSTEGDDEMIKVNFSKMPSHIEQLAFVVTIYDAHARNQSFGQVSNAYVRVDNPDTGEQLLLFDLGEDFSIETGLAVCEIYKHNGEWRFNAIGAGYSNGLEGFVKDYGLDVK
ncbi:TerD family protein [Bacillus stercoris]|nr:TerD family protein [Bacillus stercoris]